MKKAKTILERQRINELIHKLKIQLMIIKIIILRGCPRGVMVKSMDGGNVVSEFELHSRYYVHLRTNTLGKGINPIIVSAIGQIVQLLSF